MILYHWWCKFDVEHPVSKLSDQIEASTYILLYIPFLKWLSPLDSPLHMYGMTNPSTESLVCASAIVASDTWSKTETALVWTIRSGTAWNFDTFMPISLSSILLIPCASFLTANGILVPPKWAYWFCKWWQMPTWLDHHCQCHYHSPIYNLVLDIGLRHQLPYWFCQIYIQCWNQIGKACWANKFVTCLIC